LTWTHYRLLLRLESPAARAWYANEAVTQNWGTLALASQIGKLYYERLLARQNRTAVQDEAATNVAALPTMPLEFQRMHQEMIGL